MLLMRTKQLLQGGRAVRSGAVRFSWPTGIRNKQIRQPPKSSQGRNPRLSRARLKKIAFADAWLCEPHVALVSSLNRTAVPTPC